MKETKALKPENHIDLHGWMITELGLKGSELIEYAVIWTFSQHTANQMFTGSLTYLSEWANISKVSAIKALNGLQEKGLIEKKEFYENGVKFCHYRASDWGGKETLPGVKNFNRDGKETLPGDGKETLIPIKETLPQYKEKYKDKEIKDELKERGKEIPSAPSCSQIVDLFNQICVSYPQVKVLSDARRKAINARLKRYTEDDLKTAFEKAEASSFLKGSNDRNWSANFDWIIKDTNLAKILDGNYDDREPKSKMSIYKNIITHTEDLYNQGLREWVAGE